MVLMCLYISLLATCRWHLALTSIFTSNVFVQDYYPNKLCTNLGRTWVQLRFCNLNFVHVWTTRLPISFCSWFLQDFYRFRPRLVRDLTIWGYDRGHKTYHAYMGATPLLKVKFRTCLDYQTSNPPPFMVFSRVIFTQDGNFHEISIHAEHSYTLVLQ